MRNLLAILFCALLLSSCAKSTLIGDKLSDEATEQQQEQVKQEVLSLLEQEYKQPFKIVDYSYDYGVHWKDKTCTIASLCPKVFYGIYRFKVQALNNSIITPSFKIEDEKDISEGLKKFKNYWVKTLYCGNFGNYWKEHKYDKNNSVLEKNIKYCNERGQKGQYDNALTQ